MGHHDIVIHEDDDVAARKMIVDHPHTQPVSAEEEEESASESLTSETSDSEDEVDETVMEDMRKLEEDFKGISQQYRLINRIGEGNFARPPSVAATLTACRHLFYRVQS